MTEDERFELRLENWGRWCREGRPVGKTTSTAFDLSTEPNPDDEHPAPVYYRDAQLVQRAWDLMPWGQYEDRLHKALVALIYSEPGRTADAYRFYLFKVYGIRLYARDFEDARTASREQLVDIVKRLDRLEICP